MAVTSCEPAGSALVVIAAFPPEMMAEPNVVVSEANITTFVVPLGTPPLLVRVAVNFTDLPALDGFMDEVRVILRVA